MSEKTSEFQGTHLEGKIKNGTLALSSSRSKSLEVDPSLNTETVQGRNERGIKGVGEQEEMSENDSKAST